MSGILLGLYLGWVVGIGYYSAHRAIWNAQSRSFLHMALIPVLNDPSVFAFHALADPRWRKALNRDGRPLVSQLTELGPLQASQLRGGAELAWFHKFAIVAHYRLRGRFRNGTGLFRIVLIKRHGAWRIAELRIVSKGRSS